MRYGHYGKLCQVHPVSRMCCGCSRAEVKMVAHEDLAGLVLDALEAPSSEKTAEREDVESFVKAARELGWEACDPVGEGQEQRGRGESGGIHGSILSLKETVVHDSVLAARGCIRPPGVPSNPFNAKRFGPYWSKTDDLSNSGKVG